ncbi:MAG: hypothetical protein KFB96_02545 [Thiocapsa sp.]|uniref:hypothetical protein n=1 Tax=Thiocapsa sp. TaxID=2024551 RepID=UPI001BCCF5FD|nr:hypothetical protein [Thiocapsa sp.]QVL49426.1 MAG: hypothetical protein KFB96_02545 [Thiocapsa sp.]
MTPPTHLVTQLPLRHPRDEALLHGFADELWAGFTLMTQLPLRHPRDEALLHGFAGERLAGFVKRSFISRVAKRELRDQGTMTKASCS